MVKWFRKFKRESYKSNPNIDFALLVYLNSQSHLMKGMFKILCYYLTWTYSQPGLLIENEGKDTVAVELQKLWLLIEWNLVFKYIAARLFEELQPPKSMENWMKKLHGFKK